MTGADHSIDGEWSRSRLLAILGAAALIAVAMATGLAYALVRVATSDDGGSTQAEARAATDGNRTERPTRDEIASAPMSAVPNDGARPSSATASDDVPVITVPDAYVAGPAGVVTGFPRTPEGAVGQLAAIETAVLESMSAPVVHDVYDTWAMPGGTGLASWPLALDVAAFIRGARLNVDTASEATVDVVPAGAMVKGTDGADWTLACVLLVVTASLEQTQEVGYGYCERLQWVGGRWMIVPGAPPAPAPSTWPGTPAATEAGWSTWQSTEAGVSR